MAKRTWQPNTNNLPVLKSTSREGKQTGLHAPAVWDRGSSRPLPQPSSAPLLGSCGEDQLYSHSALNTHTKTHTANTAINACLALASGLRSLPKQPICLDLTASQTDRKHTPLSVCMRFFVCTCLWLQKKEERNVVKGRGMKCDYVWVCTFLHFLTCPNRAQISNEMNC